ncbi:MAG: hypothetical protein FJ104_10420, partial [Deltaproteobacteria bacterium]|nr:hypothetical protein [Deltaproteobacteria bacterium]
ALLDHLRSSARGRARVLISETTASLEVRAREALAGRPGVVAIAGGDGTVSTVLTALAACAAGGPLPPIALVGAGTVNTTLRNWGGIRSPIDAVRLLPALRGATPRATLRVSDDRGTSRVSLVFGAGLVSGFFDEYEARGAGGNALALRLVAELVVDLARGGRGLGRILEPRPAALWVDGTRRGPERQSLVLSSVLRDVGLHHLVCHRAGEDARRPHVVATGIAMSGLLREWPRVLTGRRMRDPGAIDLLAAELRVEFPSEAPYVLDGDLLRARTVTVTAGPELVIAH